MRRIARDAACGVLWLIVALSSAAADQDDSPILGRQIADFTLVDTQGDPRALEEFADNELVVVAFMGIECPLARLYAPRLQQLADEYKSKNVAFVAVDANDQDSLTEMAAFAKEHRWQFGFWKDRDQGVADRFAVVRHPAVFVLDRERIVRYAGRIDDQYGLGTTAGYSRPEVKRRDLAIALDELLAGKDVSQPTTPIAGCLIGRRQKIEPSGEVTFYKHIAPLLDHRCVACHRAGEIGPFALADYDEVVGWADMIREVVSEGRMPPWSANPDIGHFSNDARLTKEEKELLASWIDHGCPAGDPTDRPPPRTWTDGWGIGEPDAVVKMPKPFEVPAEGVVNYQYVFVDTGWTEDKWIQATETRPGNRAVVHHVNVGVIPPASGWKQGGGFGPTALSSFVPGSQPVIFPAGMAAFIPAKSKLVFQIHYTPNGVAQSDQSYVGFVFADPKTVTKRAALEVAENRKFEIPPGAVDHLLTSTYEFRADYLLLSMMPHMHLRGQSFRFEANYPDGTTEVLLDVPRYDFNWQLRYELAEPKRMPAGTKLVCVGHFDNSKANPFNPDPAKSVRFGEQTWDEMNNGFFVAAPVKDDVVPAANPDAKPDTKGDSSAIGRKIEALSLVDVHGQPRTLEEFAENELLVVAFLGTECPLARLYAPRLHQLAAEYRERGVAFVAIDSNDQDVLTELAAFAQHNHWEFPFFKDRDQSVACQFSVRRNPAVYVLDRQRVVRYEGRIDDQYGLGASSGYARPEVKRRDLAIALDELLAGKEVSQPTTATTGCLIGRRPRGAPSGEVTYTKHIAPLLQARCVSCHRAGEIGPFALVNYDEVVGWADMIREVVTDGRMPPWSASPEHGKFSNDPRSDAEKQLIGDWIEHGCPQGDPNDLPPPRKCTDGWQIDTPDQVVRITKPYKVPAEGVLAYQYFLVDPGWTEDKWIAQAEVRPGNREVVHHILVGFVPPLAKFGQKAEEGGGAPLTSFVPGSIPHVYQPGTAVLVPAKSRLIFEIHYTPNGIAQEDQSYLGVVFADPASVKKRAVYDNVESRKFTIPAGANDHELIASRKFTREYLLLSMSPHMHLRGKSFRFAAEYPDGTSEILLDVPRYDFNWQLRYELAEPKRMPAGTKLVCTARYDNSAANLANPAPDKDVHFGWQTWDEMLAGFFTAIPVENAVPPATPPVAAEKSSQ